MNELTIFEGQLQGMLPQFAQVLAGTMPVERLARTLIVSCERSPKLLQCSRQSLLNAAMTAAVLGLEVDGATGQAYLLPFANRAQLVVGYKGYNTLAARAGMTITGEVVREGDFFDYDVGQGYVSHKPSLDDPTDRRIIAAWAKASSNDRPPAVAVMSIHELLAVKKKAPGSGKSDSPWNDPAIGFPAMCSKTVKRRLARSIPLRAFQLASAIDSAVEERGQTAYLRPDQTLIVDGTASPLPTDDAVQPTADDLQGGVESPAQIIERLEQVATELGMSALEREWVALPKRVRAALGVDERDRLKAMCEETTDGNQA